MYVIVKTFVNDLDCNQFKTILLAVRFKTKEKYNTLSQLPAATKLFS